MKVLLCGDTHASKSHFNYLFEKVKELKPDVMIVLGDFGYWPRFRIGVSFLQHIQRLAEEAKLDIWWLDGNHEDHEWLSHLIPDFPSKPIPVTSNGEEYSRVLYLPRGFRFEIGGVSFMSYGGAFSVDRDSREEGIDYFEAEEVIDPDHIKSLPNEHVDVLLTHDVPMGYSFGYPIGDMSRLSEQSRLCLSELVDKTTPWFGFGGHHHKNVNFDINHKNGYCRYTILNCNNTGGNSWLLLDTQAVLGRIQAETLK